MNDIGTSLLRIDIVTGPLLYVVLGLATVQLLYFSCAPRPGSGL